MTCFDSTFMQRSFSSCQYRSTRLPVDTARLGVIPQSCVPFQSAPAFPSCFRLSLEHTLTRVPPGSVTSPTPKASHTKAKPSQVEPSQKPFAKEKTLAARKPKKLTCYNALFGPLRPAPMSVFTSSLHAPHPIFVQLAL